MIEANCQQSRGRDHAAPLEILKVVPFKLNVVSSHGLLFKRVWHLQIGSISADYQVEYVFEVRLPLEVRETLKGPTIVMSRLRTGVIQYVSSSIRIQIEQGY